MDAEKTLMKFGFVEEKNNFQLKEVLKNNLNFKEVHIDIYPDNPLVTQNPFMLLLRTSEKNVVISIDEDRIIFKRNDRHKTHFMNILISKISECFLKMCDEYFEFILNVQNIYYKITVLN